MNLKSNRKDKLYKNYAAAIGAGLAATVAGLAEHQRVQYLTGNDSGIRLAFLIGLAASVGAGISMAFAEGLSDDGKLTGRGRPLVRGVTCGIMTFLGGIGHTLPFLIPQFHTAMTVAIIVVIIELIAIAWIRKRFMNTPFLSATIQVIIGGTIVFFAGVLIGQS